MVSVLSQYSVRTLGHARKKGTTTLTLALIFEKLAFLLLKKKIAMVD